MKKLKSWVFVVHTEKSQHIKAEEDNIIEGVLVCIWYLPGFWDNSETDIDIYNPIPEHVHKLTIMWWIEGERRKRRGKELGEMAMLHLKLSFTTKKGHTKTHVYISIYAYMHLCTICTCMHACVFVQNHMSQIWYRAWVCISLCARECA